MNESRQKALNTPDVLFTKWIEKKKLVKKIRATPKK